jgi:Ca2+-binding EF-hand superfamily protein
VCRKKKDQIANRVQQEPFKDMEQEILRCFDAFDRGQKGYLDKDDLKVAATALLGRRPTKFEVQKWIRSAGTRAAAEDGEGEGQGIGVDRAAFLGIMSPILAQVDDLDRMRCAFKAFDISCRGFITMKDFRAGMSEACPAMPEAQVRA